MLGDGVCGRNSESHGVRKLLEGRHDHPCGADGRCDVQVHHRGAVDKRGRVKVVPVTLAADDLDVVARAAL